MALRFLPALYREALAEGVRATVLRPAIALQRGTVESAGRLLDPRRLRAERDSLAAYLVGQGAVQAENRQLRALLGLKQRLPQSFVPAEVIRVPERGFAGAFLLSAGRADSVVPGAPIVAPGGLVGVVREADDAASLGIDWTNPEFRASAMTTDGETFGIVEPREGPEGEQILALSGTAFHSELPEGTLIVTSGRGGVYPRGIPIGSIIGAEDSDTGWRRSYLIRPFVSPAAMTHVLVLGAPQQSLSNADLALGWGIRAAEPAPIDTAALPVPQIEVGRLPASATPRVGEGAALPAATAESPSATPAPAATTRSPAPAAAPARSRPRLLGEPIQRDTGGRRREERR